MNRREFLRHLAAAGISLPVLPGMADTITNAGKSATDKTSRTRNLVLVELQGGNDGLNTVVPYADAQYSRLRPNIGLKPEQILKLDEFMGLHQALEPLMPIWQRGHMATLQGVGYPAPNRSHFRSIEIWETASKSDQILIDGWLKPVTESMPVRKHLPIKAVALAQDEGPLAGATNNTVVFNNLNGFVRQAKDLKIQQALPNNPALNHILAVENTTRAAARSFAKQLDKLQGQSDSDLPKKTPKLVRQLDLIAQLIQLNIGPQIYKVSIGSFDTHSNQPTRHANLMQQLALGLAHLEQRLSASGHWQDVLVMTYSEFGRRAAENGNLGTDHGAAAPHFMLGGKVKGGLYGERPILGKLENNDVPFNTDFRQLYSTVSRNWFGQRLSDTPYANFDALPILKSV